MSEDPSNRTIQTSTWEKVGLKLRSIWRQVWAQVLATIVGGLALISILAGLRWLPENGKPAWAGLVVASWMIVPPIFFFAEFHWIRKYDPDNLERAKDSQAKAEKIWAGIAAALVVLYFK